jgi:O-Antigen ligase
VKQAAAVLELAALMALALALALVPFESRFLVIPVDGLVFTELELAMTAALVTWALLLLLERRLPRVPRPVAIALVAMVAISVVSAVTAPTLAQESVRFTFRSLAFWAVFVVAVDLVRTDGIGASLVGATVVGAGLSGAIAWLDVSGAADAVLGPGRLFAVAGVTRAVGTFDYPNTAAMAWEATLLAGSGLAASRVPGWLRALALVGIVLAGSAMLLTFSRGALIGTVGAALVVAAVAASRGRVRASALAAAGAAIVIVGAVALQVASGLPISRLVIESNEGLYGATYVAADAIKLQTGAEVGVPVSVTNAGSTTWQPGGEHRVSLSYHWLDPATGAIAIRDGARTPLPGPVSPGQAIDLVGLVVAPSEPGDYVLAWDMTQEQVTWFSDQSVPMRIVRVNVSGPAVGGGSQVPPAGTALPPPSPAASRIPSRSQLWGAAVEMVRTSPLVGVGPGTFRLRYGGVLGWSDADIRIHSNDIYLELAATTGLLGLAAFLAVVGLGLAPQLSRLRRPGSGSAAGGWALRAGIFAAVLAFLVHGIVDYFFAFTGTAILFWTFLGMGLGLRRAPDPAAAPELAAPPEPAATPERLPTPGATA